MRRLTSLTGIMLLSLLVSGWGSAFAAGFCPHIAGKNLTAMEGHVCGREGAKQTQHSEAHLEAMNGMEMMPAAQGHDAGAVIPVYQLIGTCSHCLGQNSFPVTTASPRELSLHQRNAGAPVEKSATTAASLIVLFSPRFVAKQNAPPGSANRKHLLLSVFLI